MPDRPPFDMTQLGEAAVNMHELYLELKKAGFSRGEALDLLARTIAQAARPENSDDEA